MIFLHMTVRRVMIMLTHQEKKSVAHTMDTYDKPYDLSRLLMSRVRCISSSRLWFLARQESQRKMTMHGNQTRERLIKICEIRKRVKVLPFTVMRLKPATQNWLLQHIVKKIKKSNTYLTKPMCKTRTREKRKYLHIEKETFKAMLLYNK